MRLYHTGGNYRRLRRGHDPDARLDRRHRHLLGSYPGAAGGVSYAHPIGYNTGPYQNASGGGTAPTQSWGTTNDQFFSMATDVGTVADAVQPNRRYRAIT